jgi:kojibiose phosphorylase
MPHKTQTDKPRALHRALDRAFPLICFDWGGTAVLHREDDAAAVRSRVERLAALGVDVAVVSGRDVQSVDGQLRARPTVEGRLFLFLSRGSEVYVVGPGGPRLLERRQASSDEEARLTAAAEAVRDDLAEAGLQVGVIYTRLNRRRVDLAPGGLTSHVDDAAAVRRRVARRLAKAGIKDLAALVDTAHALAREAGLGHPGIGSDGRHIEIGLTDKSDALRSVLRWLVHQRGRDPAELLFVGDDFGAGADGGGNDRLAMIPELRPAIFVSVGDEPDGVPRHVVHIGGGPAALLAVLDDQIERRVRVARESFPAPVSDPAWRFEVTGFDPFREREVETWLTVANGESGTRGALEEGSAASTPATFVAGVYGDGTGEPRFRQPVPAPDWIGLRLLVQGSVFTLTNGEWLEHRRVLDMRHGVVYRYWRQRGRNGRTVDVRFARFASLADTHVLAMRAEATPLDFSGRLMWEGAVGISHAGGPVKETEFEALEEPGFLARTRGRNGGGHVLAVTTEPAPGSPVARHLEQARDVIGGRLEPGDPATVDRLAVIVSARTKVPSSDAARRALARAEQLGFDEQLRRHRAAWDERWRDADLVVRGDADDQQALRFSIFHMISTAHPAKDTVSVGARGLGGMAYFLHVFWDCEIFVLPFFIYTHPQTARTLLAYRYRNLDGARQKARDMGHKGALFPWESADRGVETTPPYGFGPGGEIVPILSGLMEHHISGDVAWGVWEYWKGSGDDAFMASMGVELMLETARFWWSRAARDAEGRYHINMVVGPDEYHEGVDDNAYTNVLARWNIRRAVDALRWLERVDSGYAEELWRRLDLSDDELDGWRHVADHLVDGFDPERLLYEQFAGFFQMDDVPIEKLRPRPMAADLLLTREVTLRSKVVKQADVVMLCYILSDEISDDVARANYDYYEPITSHGSSLSPGIHAAVAAQFGELDDAVKDFKMATAIDLADNMGNAARGLHMATMGGIWQAAVMGFAGLQRRGEALRVDPHLPPKWKSLRVPLRFRGARAVFDVRRRRSTDEVGITIERAPLRVLLDGTEHVLHPGMHRLRRARGEAWQEVSS